MATDDDLTTGRGVRVNGTALRWWATRSGGPGGQHANTTDSAVTLELTVDDAGFPEPLARRLTETYGPAVRVRAADSRSQFRNRQLARARMAELIDDAGQPQRTRRPTRPSRGAQRRRLDAKSQRAERKRNRSWRYDGD